MEEDPQLEAFERIYETSMDLGALVEVIFDERGNKATTAFENDIALAMRLAVNDPQSTEALLGFVQDMTGNARSAFLETSCRFGDHWKLSVELRASFSQPASDFLYGQRADDLVQMELNYYF